MLRRLSVHAAGEREEAGTYMLDDLSAVSLAAGVPSEFSSSKLGTAQQNYAVAGPLHLDHLAELAHRREKPRSYGRQMRELARALDADEAEVQHRTGAMLERHAAEWSAFLGSLPATSFIRQRSMVMS
jgi:hypothetical protein